MVKHENFISWQDSHEGNSYIFLVDMVHLSPEYPQP